MNKFREPTADEKKLIADFICRHHLGKPSDEERDEEYNSANVTVLNYIPDCPGFWGTLVFISYGGAIEFYETAVIKDGRIRPLKQSKEFRDDRTPTEKFMSDEKHMLEAIAENDFNEAIRIVQDAIDQDDGGVASVHFSGFEDDEDGNIIAWNKKEDRRQIIIDYLKTEDAYFGLADN